MVPDFEQIGQLLNDAPPIEMAILPCRAFVLVAHLQLALRHPGNDGESAEIARDIARRLQSKLAEIHPLIGQALETGWHPEFDVSREEFNYLENDDGL